MFTQQPPSLAIIGAGFSGTLLAHHLVTRGYVGRISLFEQSHEFGKGVAYGTQSLHHLLNVPAERMSAFPDRPNHFFEWWRSLDSAASPRGFAPRMVYGRYLTSILDEVRDSLDLRSYRVSGLTPALGVVSDRGVEQFDTVVIATGNYPPANPVARWVSADSSDQFVVNPWGIETRDPDSLGAEIFIIGSGLTAIDVIIDLTARGYRGTVTMLSRRGLLPTTHDLNVAPFDFGGRGNGARSLRQRTRLVLQEARSSERSGSHWRAVVDALRPDTQRIWAELSLKEQRRFLRHLRPYWDSHRHRVAPELHAQIAALRKEGRLRVRAGRIAGISMSRSGFLITVEERGSSSQSSYPASAIINCTGPAASLRENADPLLQSLIAQGLVSLDPLGLGFRTTPDGSVIDLHNRAHPQLFAMGPLRKGELWECTAVRELRTEAATLAERICRSSRSAHPNLAPPAASSC